MARLVDLETSADDIGKLARRLFQSGNVNFLIGSGASDPAIPVVGNVEKEIVELFEAGNIEEANAKMYDFLSIVQKPMNGLVDNATDDATDAVLHQYEVFLRIVEHILSERRTDLLPKQANVFTTNYDLFVEKASEKSVALKLNDGFSRTPSLDRRIQFSAQGFFDSLYTRGPMHTYKVEVPSVNLVKLHGSLSWIKDEEEILFGVASKESLTDDELEDPTKVREHVKSYAVVLPERVKFQETLMNQVHYDLMRIFANQMDKAHTLLVSFGFSFEDGHILHIVERALSNPTLVLLIFAYSDAAAESFGQKFASFSNVYIVRPTAGTNIDFSAFNECLHALLPSAEKS